MALTLALRRTWTNGPLAVLVGCGAADDGGASSGATGNDDETVTTAPGDSSGTATGIGPGGSTGDDATTDQGDASGTSESGGACGVTTPVEISGDQGQDPTFDLTLRGSGFDAYDGQTIEIGFTTGMRCGTASAQIACGAFAFSAPDSLEEGIYKGIQLFIDADGMAGCTEGDPTWSFTTSPIFEDLVLDMTADEALWGGGDASCLPTC